MIMLISPACFWGQHKCVLSWYLPLTLAKAKSCKLLTLTMSSDSCNSFVTPSGIGLIIYLFKLLKCVCECIFNISKKKQIHKQEQNEECYVKRINSYQIMIVIHYHWYSYWTWKENRQGTWSCCPLTLTTVCHVLSCYRKKPEKKRWELLCPWETSILCKGASDYLMEIKICEECLSCTSSP